MRRKHSRLQIDIVKGRRSLSARLNCLFRVFHVHLIKIMEMQSILITPKSKQSGVFLKKLLSKLRDVESIEIVEEKKEAPFVLLSESSLEKEWSSEEDNIWDTWAKEKLKKARK